MSQEAGFRGFWFYLEHIFFLIKFRSKQNISSNEIIVRIFEIISLLVVISLPYLNLIIINCCRWVTILLLWYSCTVQVITIILDLLMMIHLYRWLYLLFIDLFNTRVICVTCFLPDKCENLMIFVWLINKSLSQDRSLQKPFMDVSVTKVAHISIVCRCIATASM